MNYAGSVGSRTRSAEENREGEMKRELSVMGIYEEGMTVPEMSEILNAVNESMGKTGEMSRENSSMSMETPRDTTNHKSRSARDSASPDLPSNLFPNRQKPYNRNTISEDDEPVTPPETFTPVSSLYVISPSPPRIGATSTMTSTSPETPSPPPNILKKIQSVQPKQHSPIVPPKIEMWRIDPLDCKNDDVPLKALQRGPKKPPPRFKFVDGVPQVPQLLTKFVDMQLQEVARVHWEENKDKLNNDVEWGEPIEVCTGIFNGSLDKDFRPEREIPESRLRSQTQEKSKKPQETDSYAFLDSDSDDFETSQKRQKTCTSYHPNPSSYSLRRTRQPPKLLGSESSENPSKTEAKDPDFTDHSKPTTSRKRTLRNRELSIPVVSRPPREPSPEYEPLEIRGKQSSEVSPPLELQEYPRRIIPPNPSRRGPRGKKLASIDRIIYNRPQLSVEKVPRKKPEASLTEDQIESMITDDEDDDPIYVPQKTSKRAEDAVALLVKAKAAEASEAMTRREQMKAEREQQEKERQSRVQNQFREVRDAQEKERQLAKERRDKYLSGKAVRMGKRIEVLGDSRGPQGDVLEWDAGNRPTATAEEVDMFPDSSTEVQEVQCPMCGKMFPQGQEIETHADTCADSFGEEAVEAQEVEVVAKTPSSEMHECLKCGKFKSWNGHEYEEHVFHCHPEREDRAGGSQATAIVIPDSPIRAFAPLSRIKDSDIDYKAQISTRKTSPRGGNRKRRKPT